MMELRQGASFIMKPRSGDHNELQSSEGWFIKNNFITKEEHQRIQAEKERLKLELEMSESKEKGKIYKIIPANPKPFWQNAY